MPTKRARASASRLCAPSAHWTGAAMKTTSGKRTNSASVEVASAALLALAVIAPQARGNYGAAFTFSLNPAGYVGSQAEGVSGAQQVGLAENSTGITSAFLWSGSAASAVNLNPTNLPGITNSNIYGIGGNQQAGV